MRSMETLIRSVAGEHSHIFIQPLVKGGYELIFDSNTKEAAENETIAIYFPKQYKHKLEKLLHEYNPF